MRRVRKKSPKAHADRRSSNKPKRRLPYQKPALRSEAFDRAILNAKTYIGDDTRLGTLFNEASEKMASIPKEPFKDSWPYLQAMLRLVRAYSRGQYRAVSSDALLSMIAALNYLVDPFDLIPDEVPFLGYVDDAAVVNFAVRNSRDELDDFMTWEMVAP